MAYLLDTHILLWYLEDNPKLLTVHRDIIVDERAEIAVSYASFWEMAIKSSLGKLELTSSIDVIIDLLIESGITLIHIEKEDLKYLGTLPYHHRDPFDRMLISQAATREMTLMSVDEHIQLYDELVSVL